MMFRSVSVLKAASRARATNTMTSSRCLSTPPTSFTLPDLTYDYGELEPYISAEIMKIHHTKHHQAYVTNLNVAFGKLQEAEAKKDVSSIISLQQAIKFNGGGHLNHSIFWQNLLPQKQGGGVLAEGDLKKAIDAQYGGTVGLSWARLASVEKV